MPGRQPARQGWLPPPRSSAPCVWVVACVVTKDGVHHGGHVLRRGWGGEGRGHIKLASCQGFNRMQGPWLAAALSSSADSPGSVGGTTKGWSLRVGGGRRALPRPTCAATRSASSLLSTSVSMSRRVTFLTLLDRGWGGVGWGG